ncbi:MAG: Gfo/Idh/MocA family oxidoreductase [Amaricoccus sp.]|nr:Gfo/Idh/MocA family oxidoreductase [Amaricoccus sp.]
MAAPRILILGTGSMAASHAERFAGIAGCSLVAAVDVEPERARAFAGRYAIPTSFGDLGEAIAWGKFDAAVNVTPDGAHKATSLALIAAGKHVLCEKPLAVNHADAEEMAAAAEAAGVVNMVNFTYRNAAALQAARALVGAGEIGPIRHLQASYLQSWLTAKHWGDWRTDERWLWRLSSAHGSMGVLGDVGVHILDLATYAAGEPIVALGARMKVFDKAEGGVIGPYRLDVNDSVAVNVEFAGGALGVVHASRMATGKANELDLLLHGERGALRLWTDGQTSTLEACLGPDIEVQRWRPVEVAPPPVIAERFVAALQTGVNGEPDFRRGAEMQRLVDLVAASDAAGRWLSVD